MPSMRKPLLNRSPDARKLRMALGDFLRGLRVSRGLTQAQLAELADMGDGGAISNIETGRITVPPERVIALAKALASTLVCSPRPSSRSVTHGCSPRSSPMTRRA